MVFILIRIGNEHRIAYSQIVIVIGNYLIRITIIYQDAIINIDIGCFRCLGIRYRIISRSVHCINCECISMITQYIQHMFAATDQCHFIIVIFTFVSPLKNEISIILHT